LPGVRMGGSGVGGAEGSQFWWAVPVGGLASFDQPFRRSPHFGWAPPPTLWVVFGSPPTVRPRIRGVTWSCRAAEWAAAVWVGQVRSLFGALWLWVGWPVLTNLFGARHILGGRRRRLCGLLLGCRRPFGPMTNGLGGRTWQSARVGCGWSDGAGDWWVERFCLLFGNSRHCGRCTVGLWAGWALRWARGRRAVVCVGG
jgi:hypothetical protein